jgi:hypothetical protein
VLPDTQPEHGAKAKAIAFHRSLDAPASGRSTHPESGTMIRMKNRPHPRRGVLCLLVAAGVSAAGCPDEGPPPATALVAERLTPDDVSLASVEALVPRGLSAFEAWQVQRHEGAPTRVIVERFVRGQCYQRQAFARLDDSGNLVPEGAPLRGVRAVNPTVSQTPPPTLLAHALERDRLPHKDQIHVARHGREHPAWSYARLTGPEGDDRIIDVTTEFRYDLGGCAMPPRLVPRDVPAPRIADLPTHDVIARRHATWEPVPGTEGRMHPLRGDGRSIESYHCPLYVNAVRRVREEERAGREAERAAIRPATAIGDAAEPAAAEDAAEAAD